MTLDDIIGQDVAVAILKQGLATKSLGHAYLFSGKPGLGKETTARAVASSLSTEIRVLAGEETIKIDEIRALRQQVAYSSTGNLVWIITDVDRMNIEASNAFLKTLEEPHAGIYFFLTTSKLPNVLPTIISRCQHLPFRTVAEEQIVTWLAERSGKSTEDLQVRALARLAQGSIGKAWELWSDDTIEYRKGVLGKLVQLPTSSYAEVLGLSLAWSEERDLIGQDLQLFLEWHRDLLTIKNEIGCSLYNPDYKQELEKISSYYSNQWLFNIIQEIIEFRASLSGNARIRFGLGHLLLLMKKGALT